MNAVCILKNQIITSTSSYKYVDFLDCFLKHKTLMIFGDVFFKNVFNSCWYSKIWYSLHQAQWIKVWIIDRVDWVSKLDVLGLAFNGIPMDHNYFSLQPLRKQRCLLIGETNNCQCTFWLGYTALSFMF